MQNQKAENLLNLSLDATPSEREKSLELEVGYNPIDLEWDLIIKYSGSLDQVRELGANVIELQNEYAIVSIKESKIETLLAFPQIEYVEKPKRLFFSVENGKRVSCITPIERPPFQLEGEGVLIGILDSGIDYRNPAFRNADGSSRIVALWDQTIVGNNDSFGRIYTKEEIDKILNSELDEQRQLLLSQDISGHGTAVAGIAAGNGAGSIGNQYAGVAPKSRLIVVKLGNPKQGGFPRTTELMLGLDYVIKMARQLEQPIAINISFGNTYGSHDGTSLLERYMDDLSNYWKSVICVGSGNEAAAAGHTSGMMQEKEEQVIELAVQNRQTAMNIQLWKFYVDEIDLSLVSPTGVSIGTVQEVLGSQRFVLGGTEILLYYGKPNPYSTRQEIFIDMLPVNEYVTPGIWQIILKPRKITNGNYQLWLPSQSALNIGTEFLRPNSRNTLTIPSTAQRVITVGAYDSLTQSYADFSGRGNDLEQGWQSSWMKPELVAPGVEVVSTAVGGTYQSFTGTSFATPFVTGSAALMMEWGIVKGNDPYLYGEKVKAYFIKGAKKLPGFAVYPNPQIGWGALCVRDSFPV